MIGLDIVDVLDMIAQEHVEMAWSMGGREIYDRDESTGEITLMMLTEPRGDDLDDLSIKLGCMPLEEDLIEYMAAYAYHASRLIDWEKQWLKVCIYQEVEIHPYLTVTAEQYHNMLYYTEREQVLADNADNITVVVERILR